MTWLLQRQIECAVLILQKEFADKLVAYVGSEAYGWLTIVAFHYSKVELLDSVPKSMFYPPPQVDSIIVRLTPWKTEPFKVEDEEFFDRLVRWLFTQRNKKLGNSLAPFMRSTFKVGKEEAVKLARNVPFADRRAREMFPREFGELANASQKSKRVFFGDYVFVVDENVYEPAEDSFLFAENLDVKEGEQFLTWAQVAAY